MIRPATSADLPAIRRLWQESRHIFLAGGLEDLPDLLRRGSAAVGHWPGAADDLWGFVACAEAAGDEPSAHRKRISLRAAVLARRLPPDATPAELVRRVLAGLAETGPPAEVMALAEESWLIRLLTEGGFTTADYLCFYLRTRRSLPSAPPVALLRPLAQDEIPALAALDHLAFPSLWRMSRAELTELCFTCRLHAALIDGQLAGYSALALHPAEDRLDEAQAQLSRLAVHPALQGRGVGRQLLAESIAFAHAHDTYRILLNTPESNQRSRQLYEQFHFRRYGARVPVLIYQKET